MLYSALLQGISKLFGLIIQVDNNTLPVGNEGELCLLMQLKISEPSDS